MVIPKVQWVSTANLLQPSNQAFVVIREEERQRQEWPSMVSCSTGTLESKPHLDNRQPHMSNVVYTMSLPRCLSTTTTKILPLNEPQDHQPRSVYIHCVPNTGWYSSLSFASYTRARIWEFASRKITICSLQGRSFADAATSRSRI